MAYKVYNAYSGLKGVFNIHPNHVYLVKRLHHVHLGKYQKLLDSNKIIITLETCTNLQ